MTPFSQSQSSLPNKIVEFSIRPTIVLLAFLLVFQPVSTVFANESVPQPEAILEEPIVVQNDQIVKDGDNQGSTNSELSNSTDNPIDQPEKKQELTPEDSQLASLTSTTSEQYHSSNSLIVQKAPQVNELNGALIFEYNFEDVAVKFGPGLDLKLQYTSLGAEDWSPVSYGWTINIPTIQRINKKGVKSLYTSSDFTSSMFGELVQNTSGTWMPKEQNSLQVSFVFTNDTWVMTDNLGTVYTFGPTSASRMDNSIDTTQIYKWYLQSVKDTNNNVTTYTYFKDSGQIYPAKIIYGGNEDFQGFLSVDFILQPRVDVNINHQSGFAVTTSQLISEVVYNLNNQPLKKYKLNYSFGDNGRRSILDNIVAGGWGNDGQYITGQPTRFSYEQTMTGTSWSRDFSWPLPIAMNQGVLVDVNADGFTDFVHAYQPRDFPAKLDTYINNGAGGWIIDPNYAPPVAFYEDASQAAPRDLGVRMADVNGDELVDIVYHNAYVNSTWLNTGSGWAKTTTDWLTPMPFAHGQGNIGSEYCAQIADINGDGLVDMIRSYSSFGIVSDVYLNNGVNGWSKDPSWIIPEDIRDGVYIADINADGLADLVKSYNPQSIGSPVERATYINNGKAWVRDNTWTIPDGIEFGRGDQGSRLVDYNSDGLPDILRRIGSRQGPPNVNYINTGRGWATGPSIWNSPTDFVIDYSVSDQGTRLADINGDNMVDVLRSHHNSGSYTSEVFLNTKKPADLLVSITNSLGGQIYVTYKGVAQYNSGSNQLKPQLRTNPIVVSQIINDSKISDSMVSVIEYINPSFLYLSPTDKKFTGFEKVISTDAVGNKTINYYHQGNTTNSALGESNDHQSKIGKIYRTEKLNSNDNLYSVVINKWDNVTLANGSQFVKNTQTITMDYDGNSTHKDKSTTRTYNDANGNLTQEISWGEVSAQLNGTFTDIGTDKITTNITFATGSVNNVISAPAVETVLNQSNVKVKETRHYYDSQLLNVVTLGNETKTETLKKLSASYNNTQKTYNSYGMVLTEKDRNGRVTTYTYDAYNLYPTQVKNALNQITSYEYNYTVGQPKKVTTPTNFVYTYTYDGLGRLVEEKQPDLTTPATLVTKALYTYTDLLIGQRIKKSEYLDATNSKDSYQYTDGLGRLIQTRTEVEDVDQYSVSDVVYNNVGQIWKQSLPYVSTGIDRTTPTVVNNLYSTNSYDVLGRVVSVTNSVGVTSTVFDDWSMLITDARDKPKKLYYDAFGQLVRVDEYNLGNTYSTYYTYNQVGNLIKITDALGNVRNFTYDLEGNRLTAQDLHISTDTSFSTWSYAYDNNGNLTRRVDGNAQRTDYAYDNINRVKTENYTGITGTEVTYTYDTCVNGKGLLCTVAVLGGATTKYEYNSLGLVSKETKTIDAVNYVTTNVYDRQGNLTQVTLPDGYQINYLYNSAGQLEKVQTRIHSLASWSDLVSDIDYAAHGRVAFTAYSNGIQTTNSYNADQLYQLGSKVSMSGTVKLQDLGYTYDAVGNVTKIVDASAVGSGKTVDYGYDDLSRLISAASSNAASGTNYNHTFSYDAVGNILTKSDMVGQYVYGGNTGTNYANPHAVTVIGADGYSYDNNGNLIAATGTRPINHTYDYNNRLVASSVPGDLGVSYVYDHAGQRVKLTVNGVSTVYPSKLYNIKGGVVTRHIYAGADEVATVEGANIFTSLADHLTGVSVMTDSSGQVVEVVDYYPYGNMRMDQKTGTFTEQRKYAGHEYDVDTGLSYMNARYYDAVRGRFVSQDPMFLDIGSDLSRYNRKLMLLLANPRELNSYSYTTNNPLHYTDPTGEGIVNVINTLDTYNPLNVLFGEGADNIYYGAVNNRPGQILKGYGQIIGNGALVVGGALEFGIGAGEVYNLYQKYSYVNRVLTPSQLQSVSRSTRWGNPNSLQQHFDDHGSDFASRNPAEYSQKANQFYKDAQRSGYGQITGTDGVRRIYESKTNTFGSYNSDGTTRTFFKPTDGANYWDRQVGDPSKNVNIKK